MLDGFQFKRIEMIVKTMKRQKKKEKEAVEEEKPNKERPKMLILNKSIPQIFMEP